jgi:serine/threonine protein kinase/tetratricopeptide (TPR) repeat protein
MTTERIQRLKELFDECVDLDAEARQAFLDAHCPDDPELRDYVERLLREPEDGMRTADGKRYSLLRSPILTREYAPGDQIGVYTIIRRLGVGGMGEVYLAEREGQTGQTALKILPWELGSDEFRKRFERERDLMGALRGNANIAHLEYADITKDGVPYIAMEYVAGARIDEYCRQPGRSTKDVIKLMAAVARAVHFAHVKLIVHRDLKPGNILVTADGTPKLLDFGIATAIQATRSELSLSVVRDLHVMTLKYASPEQIKGEPPNVGMDVYSLGVILYVLLTGVHPQRVEGVPETEVKRRILEVDAELPSIAAQESKDALASPQELRGDLGNILLKAIHKDPGQRYESADQLAGELVNYLEGRPVKARPDTRLYRMKKFVQRHKKGVAATAAFLFLLIGGAITVAIEAKVAQDERAAAQAVNDFLQNDLLAQASANTQASPSTKPDPDLKVRTALDRAAVRIAGKFDRQPEVEAAIRDTIGQAYNDVGQYPEARKHLQRALDLYRRVLGPENPNTLKTMSRLGATAWRQGKYLEAEALLNQTSQMQRRVQGPEHPDTLASMNALANCYSAQGNYAQSEVLNDQTLKIKRRVLGSEHPDTLAAMNNLAIDYNSQGKYARAEALNKEALEIKRRVLGPEHPDTLKSMNNLAYTYRMEGKYANAETIFNQTLEIKRRALGPEHPNTLLSMSNLASTCYLEGKYAEAQALFNESLEIKRRVLGLEHPDTLVSMNNLASTWYQQGKYVQAEALFNQVLEISRRVLGSKNPYTLTFSSEMAGMYQRQGKYDKAEKIAAQVLAGQRNTAGPENPGTSDAAADLALAYQSQRKFAASESLAREAVEFDRKKRPDDWQRFRAESLLGASLAGQKKYAEAEPLLLAGYQGMAARKDRMAVPDWYHLHRARDWIVQLYLAWGQPQRVTEWKKK